MIYILKPTPTGVFQEFGISFLFFWVFLFVTIITPSSSLNWIFILLSLYFIRLSIYSLSDFLFCKEISKQLEVSYMRFCFLKLPILKDAFLSIQKSSLPSRYGSKHYYLVLNRKDKHYIGKYFKNKIKLYVEDGDLDLIGIARKIERMFQIEYRGVIDINGSENDLMKNKGTIP